jgi:hypothetical protein
MTDDPGKLSPADPDELRLAISLALQQDGRRRFRHSDGLMAKLVADHLVRYLEVRNCVIMQKPRRRPDPAPFIQRRSDVLHRVRRRPRPIQAFAGCRARIQAGHYPLFDQCALGLAEHAQQPDSVRPDGGLVSSTCWCR